MSNQMSVYHTTAPIPIEDLKKYFVDKNIQYSIDYSKSSLKGCKLLTYLSNLDIPSDIDLSASTSEEVLELLKEYLESTMIVNVNSLESLTIMMLHEYKGVSMHDGYIPIFGTFINENRELIDKWISRIESLSVYAMHTIDTDETRDFAKSFPEDDSSDLVGVNFVSLIKHESMYALMQNIDSSRLKYYSKYFNEYMFKGKNLYSYWSCGTNPMFLLTYGIVSGELNAEEYVSARNQSIKEVTEDVSSIQ